MEELFEKAKRNTLLKGIDFDEFKSMLKCLEGRTKTYHKGAYVWMAGDPVSSIGLVISGCVQIIQEDTQGKQNLVAEVEESQLFGEVFACAGISHSPVTVIAAAHTEILLMDYRRIITVCPSSCQFHQRLIENMLSLMAKKNLLLNQKIALLSKRTTRERLLLYFNQCRQGAKRFTLPFNREELAAYLCVERSALSAEMSRMQKDGLIRYWKNEVEITDRQN